MQLRSSALLHGLWLTLAAALVLPGEAMAAWGDENWGTMVWGQGASPPVLPPLGVVGLTLLAMSLAGAAAWTLRKQRPVLGLTLGLVLLAIPLIVVADTLVLPNTFENGTVANADQVNANFEAVETAVENNDSRITAAQGTANAAVTNAAAAQSTASAAQSAATTNTTEVSNLASTIATNTEAITALQEAEVPVRFEACPDGWTVADHETGLLWEKKTGTPASSLADPCETVGCPDAHDVNNRYEFSDTGTAPDGGAFTDFLARLNDDSQPATWETFDSSVNGVQTGGCFAGHCDWRLPHIRELETILRRGSSDSGTGMLLDCDGEPYDVAPPLGPAPCIDPIFGPTTSSGAGYWSASTFTFTQAIAYTAIFGNGFGGTNDKLSDIFVRAVRAGSCTN